VENVHVLAQRVAGRGEFLPLSAEFYRSNPIEQAHALVAQLQKTLELNKIINIFSIEAAKVLPFLSLQFHSTEGVVEMSGSKHIGQTVSFDLEVEDERLGQLIYFTKQPVTVTIKEQLQKLHSILLYPLRNALLFHRVKKLATKDSLTGLGNRSHFDDSLNRKLERCRRHHRSFGLMLLDLDNFKAVNDTHGHQVGDTILRRFADLLSFSVRGTDTIFRFGGDEFAILVDDDHHAVSNILAKRIQDAVHRDLLLKQHEVTTSIGFTLATSKDDHLQIFERADKALYKAKNNGRDCSFAF
jgi:diguanylate cyclase (GGDEF)-like protein